MKILASNFLTCAVKACKSSPDSFPLHFRDAELEQTEMEFNPLFLKNILPRIEWDALKVVAAELGFTSLPASKPLFPSPSLTTPAQEPTTDSMDTDNEPEQPSSAPVPAEEQDALLRHLHTILLETQVMEGKLACGNCGHEYSIKNGIASLLLPGHLV